MCDFGPELRVDGETTVEGFSRTGGETERKFALEHENRDAGWVWEGEEFEDEGGGNLGACQKWSGNEGFMSIDYNIPDMECWKCKHQTPATQS